MTFYELWKTLDASTSVEVKAHGKTTRQRTKYELSKDYDENEVKSVSVDASGRIVVEVKA